MTTLAELPTLWRNRDFLRFWFGESLSLLGTQVTTLALPLTAIHAFGASDSQVGVLRFLQLAPYLGLALIFGVWVDRARRRRVMLGANLVRMVLLALIPVLHWLDLLSLPSLLAMACAIGIASVLYDVSWMSYVPVLVEDPRHYVEASSKLAVSSSATDVAGPGLAGLLISWLTAPVALIVDACSYALSAISLLLIRKPEPRPDPALRRPVMAELRDGLRWVFGTPVLRALALIGCCCNFSMITVWTMFLLYATNDLHLGARTLGLIFATASAGGLIGAALARRIVARFRVGRVYLVAQSLLLLGPTLLVIAAGRLGGDVRAELLRHLPGPRCRRCHHRQPAADQHAASDDGPDDRRVPHAAVRWWCPRRSQCGPARGSGRRTGCTDRRRDRISRRGGGRLSLAGRPTSPAARIGRPGTSGLTCW